MEQVKAALTSDPRVYEHLELFTDGWSERDKEDARLILIDAAKDGDVRVPGVLWTVTSSGELVDALEEILAAGPPSVQVSAAEALSELRVGGLASHIAALVNGRSLRGHFLNRACRFIATTGGSVRLVALIEASRDEVVRGALIDSLWGVERLNHFPMVWFEGLGLVHRAVRIPAASFRDSAWSEIKRLIGSSPVALGYVPIHGVSVPAELHAVVMDIFRGKGEPDPNLLSGLTDAQRRAALVTAADSLMNKGKPRGAHYVAVLGGDAHRDVLEWASVQPDTTIAQAGQDALASLEGVTPSP